MIKIHYKRFWYLGFVIFASFRQAGIWVLLLLRKQCLSTAPRGAEERIVFQSSAHPLSIQVM